MRRQELHPRTAVINKTQKNLSRKARYEALQWLATTFPEAFDNTRCIRPLKHGIAEDVLEHADQAEQAGISRSKLREAIVLFTRRIDYLTCLKTREMRVDLTGNPVIAVTEEEAERASLKIKKRIEKCARNAKKTLTNKTSDKPVKTVISKPAPTLSQPAFYSGNDSHSNRDNQAMYGAQNTIISPAKTAAVIVKHKSARSYDPEAVARLKEKLGLKRNEAKEAAEN